MRMWEIRENHSDSGKEKEAYECGYEEGYRDAMEEFEEHESRPNYRMGYSKRSRR